MKGFDVMQASITECIDQKCKDLLAVIDSNQKQNSEFQNGLIEEIIDINQLLKAGNDLAGRSIDWSALDVPVISIGVPLAITAGTFIQSGALTEETFTTLHAHHAVAASSFIISYAILRTCWPDLTTQDCIDFIRFNRDVIPYPDRNFDEDDTGDNAVPDETT